MVFNSKTHFNIFRVYQLINNQKLYNYLKEFEKTQWLSEDELNRLQWIKLKKLLNYAYNNVPFYRNCFKELNISDKGIRCYEDFLKIPLMSKDDIEKNFSALLSLQYSSKDRVINSTGGSTGRNLNFYLDKKKTGTRGAINLRGDKWAGLDIGVKHVYIWGHPLDNAIQSNIKNRIYNYLSGRGLFLSAYNLSDSNMHEYAKKIIKYNPEVIVGYSSPLYFFSDFLRKNSYKISLNSVISSAETLFEFQRECIESVFSCKVFNRYASREFGHIAQECSEHSGLHLNMEHIYLECLDKKGNPVTDSSYGELVITDLDNFAMPLIRYKIEDYGKMLNKICNCGRKLSLIDIQGRTFDIIIGANGNVMGGTYWTLLFRSIEGIKQFQVIQISKTKIKIKIVTDDDFDEKNIELITEKIQNQCGNQMKIEIEIIDDIPLTKSGKHRFVISKLKKNEISDS